MPKLNQKERRKNLVLVTLCFKILALGNLQGEAGGT